MSTHTHMLYVCGVCVRARAHGVCVCLYACMVCVLTNICMNECVCSQACTFIRTCIV